jgi:hypothetical protein
VNVLSIAGIPGIGENVVTHGLGPGPSSPTPTPTPTPVRPKVLPGQQQSGAGGGGSATRATNCEPIWREEWRDRLREQKRKQHEREMRAELDRIEKLKAQQAESVIDELLEEGPPAEPPITDVVIESVYEPLAVGIQGRVRAAVEGVVHYKTDKVVEIVADDGARHVYEGVKKIAAGPVEGDRVDEGETIGRAVRTVVDHRIEREVPAPAVAVGPYPRSELATQAEPWTRVEVQTSTWPSSVPQVSPSPVASSPPPPPVRIERGVPVATVEARVSAVTQSLPAFPYPRTDQATRTDPDVQGPGKPETLGTPPTESTAVSLGKAALVVAAAAAGVVLIAKAGSSTPGPSRKARASRASEATPSVKKAAKAPVFRFKSLKNPLPRPAGSPAAQPEPKPRTRRSTKGKPVQEVALEPARSKRARPIEDVVDYPPHAKIQEKWIRCGKPDCYSCPHGPYLQAMWWGDDGKVKTKYLGKKTR